MFIGKLPITIRLDLMKLHIFKKSLLRDLSFLKLSTGVEEFSEGYQIFRSCYIGVSNILEKAVKYLMGCESFLSKNYVFFYNISSICFCYVH